MYFLCVPVVKVVYVCEQIIRVLKGLKVCFCVNLLGEGNEGTHKLVNLLP